MKKDMERSENMKKENMIIKNRNNEYVFHPKLLVLLSENNVKSAKLKSGEIFFIVPNKNVFLEVKKNFKIPKDFIFVEKHFANKELFAYSDNMCEKNEKLLGGITAIENAFIGDGIYCVPEQDYLRDRKSLSNLKSYNFKRTGIKTDKDVTLIFEYTGYYYKTLNTVDYKGICKLLCFHISLDEIKAIIESYVEYLIA